jgi:hypothetical protein
VPGRLVARRECESAFAERLGRAFALRAELRALARPDTIVCRCEDVALGRLATAASLREAKLHTRAGMGPCQGRVCGSALSVLRGFPRDTVRPPLLPTPVSILTGPDEDDPRGATTAPAAAARFPAPRSA